VAEVKDKESRRKPRKRTKKPHCFWCCERELLRSLINSLSKTAPPVVHEGQLGVNVLTIISLIFTNADPRYAGRLDDKQGGDTIVTIERIKTVIAFNAEWADKPTWLRLTSEQIFLETDRWGRA